MDEITYIDHVDISSKRVLVRVDYNVSLLSDGITIADDTRIRQSLATIEYLLRNHNKLILVSHLGRPEGRDEKYSLKTVAVHLESLLPNVSVRLVDDFASSEGQHELADQHAGEILLLENIRYFTGEQRNDPAFAQKLSELADVYINDAFGVSHRRDASVVGVPRYLPSYGGLLLKKEIETLSKLLENPKKPFVAILGGAKVSTKINLLYRLVEIADHVLLGGGIANTFLLEKGLPIGKSLAEADQLDNIRKIIAHAKDKNTQILMPEDAVVTQDLNAENESQVVEAEEVPADSYIADIGPLTQAEYGNVIARAATIVWNGPVGYFENPAFARGTEFLYYSITQNTHCLSVVGGGDTLAAVSKKEYIDKITHISTGGGAMLEFIERGTLPGIEALRGRGNQK